MSAGLALPTSAPAGLDRISSVTLSSVTLPLPNPISDAKVFTGRQRDRRRPPLSRARTL